MPKPSEKRIAWETLFSLARGNPAADWCDFCDLYDDCFGKAVVNNCPLWASLPEVGEVDVDMKGNILLNQSLIRENDELTRRIAILESLTGAGDDWWTDAKNYAPRDLRERMKRIREELSDDPAPAEGECAPGEVL
jgi:hypothetical protein